MSHTIEIYIKSPREDSSYLCIKNPWNPDKSHINNAAGVHSFYDPEGILFAGVPENELHFFVVKETSDDSPEV